MPLFDFKCDHCGVVQEFSTNSSLPKSMQVPENCPKCNTGKLVKQFSVSGQSFDVVGGYDYEYGKKAWKKNKSVSEQADILTGDKTPY